MQSIALVLLAFFTSKGLAESPPIPVTDPREDVYTAFLERYRLVGTEHGKGVTCFNISRRQGGSEGEEGEGEGGQNGTKADQQTGQQQSQQTTKGEARRRWSKLCAKGGLCQYDKTTADKRTSTVSPSMEKSQRQLRYLEWIFRLPTTTEPKRICLSARLPLVRFLEGKFNATITDEQRLRQEWEELNKTSQDSGFGKDFADFGSFLEWKKARRAGHMKKFRLAGHFRKQPRTGPAIKSKLLKTLVAQNATTQEMSRVYHSDTFAL